MLLISSFTLCYVQVLSRDVGVSCFCFELTVNFQYRRLCVVVFTDCVIGSILYNHLKESEQDFLSGAIAVCL